LSAYFWVTIEVPPSEFVDVKVDVKIGGAVVVTAPFELVVVKNTGLDNVVLILG